MINSDLIITIHNFRLFDTIIFKIYKFSDGTFLIDLFLNQRWNSYIIIRIRFSLPIVLILNLSRKIYQQSILKILKINILEIHLYFWTFEPGHIETIFMSLLIAKYADHIFVYVSMIQNQFSAISTIMSFFKAFLTKFCIYKQTILFIMIFFFSTNQTIFLRFTDWSFVIHQTKWTNLDALTFHFIILSRCIPTRKFS